MKNILIIGGSGFIGRNLIEVLCRQKDYSVTVLNGSTTTGITVQDGVNVTHVKGTLEDLALVRSILSENAIDSVVHLASMLVPGSTKEEFDAELQRVVLPSFELIALLASMRVKLLFMSSGGTVYGNIHGNIPEDTKCNPLNYYGYSKLLLENHIRFIHRMYQLDYVILRPSNVYGKYQKSEGRQGLIAVAASRLMRGLPIDIWGDGQAVRDYIDVGDLAEAIEQILRKDVRNEIFNIGSGVGMSVLGVLSALRKQLGTEGQVTFSPKRAVDVDHIVLDIGRLRSYIHFEPMSLEEGISRYVQWLQDQKQ